MRAILLLIALAAAVPPKLVLFELYFAASPRWLGPGLALETRQDALVLFATCAAIMLGSLKVAASKMGLMMGSRSVSPIAGC